MEPEDGKPPTGYPAEGTHPSERSGSDEKSTAPSSRPDERDEIPRRTSWAAMPKRSLMRILILLAALVGIIYLREQTSSIAGCMSNAFREAAPGPTEPRSAAVRARIELRLDASGVPSP